MQRLVLFVLVARCVGIGFGFQWTGRAGMELGNIEVEAKFDLSANTLGLIASAPQSRSTDLPSWTTGISELSRSQDHHEIYDQALQILESMKSSPSCQQAATNDLLGSCQSIDGTSSDSDVILDGRRSVYAARLAVCEIEASKSTIPPRCTSLDRAWKDEGLREQQESLRQCLTSLESKPQWWTSYSNNRQNALVICQAVRGGLEKGESMYVSCPIGADVLVEELLGMHRKLVNVQTSASDALEDAVLQAQQATAQHSHNLAMLERKVQAGVLEKIQVADGSVKAFIGNLSGQLEAAIKAMVDKISSVTHSTETDIAKMKQV